MSDGYQFHQNFPDPEATSHERETFMGGVLISTRMGIFILIGLTSIALLVGGLYLAGREMSAATNDVTSAFRITSTVTALETRAWRIRNDEKDYLLSGEPQYVATHKANVEAFTNMLSRLKVMPNSEALKKHIDTISEAVTQQVGEFSKIVKSDGGSTSASANSIRSRLINSGQMMGNTLAKSEMAEIGNILAAIKKYQASFIKKGGDNNLARLRNLSGELLALVGNKPSKGNGKSQVRIMIKAYQTNLNAYAMQRLNRKKMTVRLGEIFSYMTTNLDNLAASADSVLKKSERKARRIRDDLQILLPAGGSAFLLLTILFGHIFMRSIAVPVREIAIAARKLAAGENEVAIPAIGNKDEVGDIAFALTDIKASLAHAGQIANDLSEIKDDNGTANKAAMDENAWLRKDLEAALEESARLRKAVDETKSQVEKGETAAIEAALLRIDLATTKAELEKAIAAKSIDAGMPDTAVLESGPDTVRPRSGPISTVSKKLAISSKVASAAAYEAERTGTLIRGLNDAAEKIGEVETMLGTISEQTDVIVYPPDVKEPPRGDANSNLVVLTSEYRHAVDQASGKATETNEVIGQRFDAIRTTTNKVTWAVRDISETINEVKRLAFEIASASSEEALKVTSELLEQSEHLRGMLGSLMDNMRGGVSDQADGDADEAKKKDHPTSYLS